MDTNVQAFDRAKQIVETLTRGICDLVSPYNLSFKQAVTKNAKEKDVEPKKFLTNAADLVFFGNRHVRIIVQSLLSSSFQQEVCKEALQRAVEKYAGTAFGIAALQKSTMGKYQFASLRKVFMVLREGNNVPNHNYTYKIDSKKLATAISFLQESLLVNPGVAHDVRISGHTFKDMPVYERGGKSIESLNKSYNEVFSKDERFGRDIFTDIIKLLTKHGESKAGLLTYYIQLRYCGLVFIWIMKRVFTFLYAKFRGTTGCEECSKQTSEGIG